MQKLTKIYGNLTDKEKAALAFSYVSQGDLAEHERVVSTVQMQSFTGLALEYRHWTINLQNLAFLWALEHWRTYAIALITRGALATSRDLSTPEFRQLIEREAELSGRLMALDRVLSELCDEHRIEEASIRRLAGVLEQFHPIDDLEPTADQVTEIKNILAVTVSEN